METNDAIKSLSALAQESRLAVFKLLVRAGGGGVAAGEIARILETAANTLSWQLTILANAGLITARRDGRSIFYMANFDRMSDLLLYLLEDCCQGRPEVCAPLTHLAGWAARCGQPEGALS